jgi:hypothetical protein
MEQTFAELTARGIKIDRPPRRNAQSGRMTMNAHDPQGKGLTIQFVD